MSAKGSETPRIHTPPLRELTPETSLGFECVEFVQDGMGIDLLPWQRWFLIHALELNGDGSMRFRTCILLVARQSGKTTILKILALYWMYILGRRLVIGTAQNLDVAEETWNDTVDLAESIEELAADIKVVTRGSGKKALELKTGERYKVAASSRGGGRGLSGDLVAMDELREHRDWRSWAAVTNTTMAIRDALVIAASNAGDYGSVVLRQLRFMCMSDPRTVGVTQEELNSFGLLPATIDQPDDIGTDTVGIFEWSALPGCEIWDRDGWSAANPARGYTVSDEALATQAKIAQAGGEAEWVFRTENLCQWRPTAGGGPFPDGSWDACLDLESRISDESPIGVCVDVSADRGMAYAAVAGFRSDGDLHVEVSAARSGTEWIVPWLTSDDRYARSRWLGVAWQLNGAPVSSLTDELRASELPLMEWSGSDLARAHGQMFDLVMEPRPNETKRRVFHVQQPVLDVPASTGVTRPLGDGWVLDRRRSPVDVAPLIAAVGACWVLAPRPEEDMKRPQVHEWPSDLEAPADGEDQRLVEPFTGNRAARDALV